MTRWKAALAGLLALALVSIAPPPDLHAQILDVRTLGSTPLNHSNAAVSTDVALIVLYKGATAAASATVAVDATSGDLTFLPNETANGVECPVSGALDSDAIDVSDTACNTFGEVCDAINASADWRCVLLDVMRSDDADVSSGALITLAATSAKRPDGLGILLDNTTTFLASRALLPPFARRMEFYCEDSNCNVLKTNPFANWRPFLQGGTFTSTYGSGTSAINIYSEVPGAGSSVEKLEYTRISGASTVNAEVTNFNLLPLLGPDGGKFHARITNSAAMSAVTLAGVGFAIDRRLLPTPGF